MITRGNAIKSVARMLQLGGPTSSPVVPNPKSRTLQPPRTSPAELESSEGKPRRFVSLIGPIIGGWLRSKRFTVPFALQSNHHPRGAGLVNLLIDRCVEADSAHDPISELLIHDGLVCVAVVLHDLVEPVDQGLDGRHGSSPAPVREPQQLVGEVLLGDAENLRQLINILGGCLSLAVKERGGGNLAAPKLLSDGLKAQPLCSLGVEKRLRVGGQAINDRALLSV